MRPPYFPYLLRAPGRHRLPRRAQGRPDGQKRRRSRSGRFPTAVRQSVTAYEWGGVTVTYVSDHQAPARLDTVPDNVPRAGRRSRSVDPRRPVHPVEFAEKSHWGHCTIDTPSRSPRRRAPRGSSSFTTTPLTATTCLDGLLVDAKGTAGHGRARGAGRLRGPAAHPLSARPERVRDRHRNSNRDVELRPAPHLSRAPDPLR